MFYFHHVAWELFSRICMVPTLLLTLYRLLYGEVGIFSDWSRVHIREKYSSFLDAFNPFFWDYKSSVDEKGLKNGVNGGKGDYKKTDGDDN